MNSEDTGNILKTILIADDDPQVRGLLRKLLEKKTRCIFEVSNGAKCILSCKEVETDLVLIDIIMPEKDGLTTIQEIKALCPQTKIIAISGDHVFTAETYLDEAKELGVDMVFAKPVENARLIQAVEDLLMG